jgi:hypothetical protein
MNRHAYDPVESRMIFDSTPSSPSGARGQLGIEIASSNVDLGVTRLLHKTPSRADRECPDAAMR